MDYKQNIGDTTLSDQYDPNAGRITVLNSRKFPVLRFMQMSAVRGSLRPVRSSSMHMISKVSIE